MAAQPRPFVTSGSMGSLNAVGLDRSRRLAWESVQNTDITQRTAPAADPTQSGWIHKLSLGNEFKLLFGKIVDEIAYTNCYKVQPEHGVAALWCNALSPTGLQPIGARQFGQIPVGSLVIFAQHPQDTFGIILGVIPSASIDSQSAVPDFISQASRAGLLVDSAHSYPLSQAYASLITDWSAGRPVDTTGEGEYGQITETGLLNFIDSFMTANRVDEECGIWHFYPDALTRLAGHNFQLWTTGTEREDTDDEGEFNVVKGYTPYYWEALGAYDLGADVCRSVAAEDWQHDETQQGYSGQEPVADDQTPFMRLKEFYGYLGQAYKRVLCLPPQCAVGSESIDSSINQLGAETIYPGVFDETITLTGRYSLRSAHEIIFSKHIAIPTPKQIYLPQDPNGDNSTDYKAAGILGAGTSHIVDGEIAVTGVENPTQIRVATFMDNHAFVFNWVNCHPFYYHTKDWYLPEEGDLDYLGGCAAPAFDPPRFNDLTCHHFIEAPAAIPLNVDHRYGDVNYYPNHSYIGMLADGGIVIGDGFGAEIRMANGHIWLTAPGDCNIHSGRDIVNLAGFDHVIRAKNSCDMTATNKDVRIKANNNLWMAATGETGGVLIQSMATAVETNADTGEEAIMSGISLKANDSLINTCSKHFGLKLTDQDAESVLIFDTGDTGRIKFKCQYFERFMTSDGAAFDFWGTTQGAEWWASGTVLSAPLVVNSRLLVSGCGVFGDDVVSVSGHMIAGTADDDCGKVLQLGTNTFDTTFSYYTTRTSTTIPSIAVAELETLMDRQETFTFCDTDFTYRSVANYKTEEYVLFESRWQQIARITSVPTATWTEEPVLDTYPYPGKEVLLDNTFKQIDLTIYDTSTSLADDRGASYQTPATAAPVSVELNTNYTVIM